jgi:hypothetical protein
MTNDPFDVAISFDDGDKWFAEDIHEVMTAYGLSVYCYTKMIDAAGGRLRENLKRVYDESRINVIVWSKAYADSIEPKMCAMERRFLLDRHVMLNDSKGLIIANIDGHPVDRDMLSLSHYNLRDVGVTGFEKLLHGRVGALRSGRQADHSVHHPIGMERYRSPIQPCTFSISPSVKSDGLGRWQSLGDILVDFPNEYRTRHVYLIPSGACQVNMRHPDQLRNKAMFLDTKRDIGEAFCVENMGQDISGYWFSYTPLNSEREVVAIYSKAYDQFLNERFENALAKRNLQSSASRS